MRASVVVPVYNSEQTLEDLVSELVDVLAQCSAAHEILLIDDGSTDGSWGVIEAIVATTAGVRAIRLTRNFGEHNAVLCGIRAARHEVIVTVGDDLQQPPSEIPVLLDALVAGTDVVYGTPVRERHGHARVLVSRVSKLALASVGGVPGATTLSSFRAFRTELRDSFGVVAGPRCSVDVLLMRATRRIKSVPIRHDFRRVGRSNYTPQMLVDHAVDLMTGSSVRPLRLVWLLGAGLTVVGSLLLIAIVMVGVTGTTDLSDTWVLGVFISLLTGLQLLAIGLLGEYVGRLHLSIIGAPTYVTAVSIEGRQ